MKLTEANDMIVIMNTTDEERKILLALAKNKPIPPDLVTAAQVAAIFGVHEKTIRRWSASGLIQPIRIGKRAVRYNSAEIVAVARTGTNHTTVAGGVVGSESTGGLEKQQNGGV